MNSCLPTHGLTDPDIQIAYSAGLTRNLILERFNYIRCYADYGGVNYEFRNLSKEIDVGVVGTL